MSDLSLPETPYAVVDRERVRRNAQRLTDRLAGLGVPLRLHVKTAKAPEVAELVFGEANTGAIAVSTLAEAEAFADAGYTDIFYAVGITAAKLSRVLALLRRGVMLTVLLDSAEQARAVAEASRTAGVAIPALIEIDCDGHRSGLSPADPAVVELARLLADGGAEPRGVLTHAGESYHATSPQELHDAADNERDSIGRAAAQLRDAGFACPVVSLGSTPTALAATDLSGVTDVRAGNFVFFDLVMNRVGVCALDDIALSVVVTVIGHQPDKQWVITDGGWMATSQDRASDGQYGLVCDLAGKLIPELVMRQANQEHGILSLREGSNAALPILPVGTRLRILPHHACATAAQHREYHLVDGNTTIRGTWSRMTGW
jgi:D-serine deaminase-like pyridoxal phosphate-dependent protein